MAALNILGIGDEEQQRSLLGIPGAQVLDISPPTQAGQGDLPVEQRDALAGLYNNVTDYIKRERERSSDMGLWDDATGLPTGKGLLSAAQQYGEGLLMGTTAPMTPKLLPAIRVGGQRVTGVNHQVLEREYPDIASHPESELGFVNPAGRWLTRPQAFQYALEHDLIDPKRAAEAQRFKDAMEETGNTRNLFLPSEWLKKYGLAGLMLGGGAAAGAQGSGE